jgi:hypothetical protein
MIYRILLVVAVIVAAVVSFFCLWGVSDGSLYGDAGLVLVIVLVAWGLVGASWLLRRRKVPILPEILLLPLVGPGTLYGLMILVFVLSGESWR